jgi:hypothetical protein
LPHIHRPATTLSLTTAAFCLALAPMPVLSQGAEGGAAAEPATTLGVTATLVTEPPRIDGRLDDAAWQGASRLTDFVQQRPIEGAVATESTDVFVAYDNRTIYIGIHAHYSDTALLRANRVDRDETGNDDTVAVLFDPFLDRQRGYSFSVNAYGVQADALLRGTVGGADGSWNVYYESAGTLVDDGWTAEMAIPIQSLRYPSPDAGNAHRWGFQVRREIRSKDETVTWSPVSSDVMGTLAQMGRLEGMRDLSTRRTLEVLPTVTAIRTGTLDATGRLASDNVAEAGLNVKYGLTPNITLDVTFNPDFSQIESDRAQIEVNQRFPLFFPELRPFFLEGQEIFRVLGPFNLLHTRTILDPQYGVKLTGKTGKTTFGVLVANDQAPGRRVDPDDPGFGKAAQILSGRLRYDVGQESFVGVLVNDVEFGNQHSRVALFDGSYRVGKNHRVQTTAALTDHRDAAGVSRTGHAVDVGLVKQSRTLGYILAQNLVSPDYRNDLGFIARTNYAKTWSSISYRWWPEHWLINWGPSLNYDWVWDYDGVLQDKDLGLNVQANFAKNISASAKVSRLTERFLDHEFNKTRLSLSGTVNTSRRVSFSASLNRGDEIRFVADPFLGRTTGFRASSTLRPFSRLQSQISLTTSRFTDVRTGTKVFDVKILDARTTYQFTERLLVRHILEHNTLNRTLGLNLLATYRVNAGTVFFVGYDDRFQQSDRITVLPSPTSEYRRTNRAVFTKLQYLFRR